MSMTNRPGADGNGPGPPNNGYTDAFDLVSDGTRLGILRELATAQAEDPHDPALRFSALRERLDNPDSGTFNYHLDRLRGRFVYRTETGYVLTPAGHRLAAAVAAGLYDDSGESIEAVLEDTCPICGEALTVAHNEGVLAVECPNGHGLRNLFPAGALAGRSIEAARSLFDRVTTQQVALAVDGDCPLCYARTAVRLVNRKTTDDATSAEATSWTIEAVCRRCGAVVSVPVPLALAGHPVVTALLTANGHDPREQPIWGGNRVDAWSVEPSDTLDTDGSGILATVTIDDDTARFRVNEDANVSILDTPTWLVWTED